MCAPITTTKSASLLLMNTHTLKLCTLNLAGLQYAEEVGVENDPNPGYHCSLCNITIDGGNQSLHFTSTAHRMNVLVRHTLSYMHVHVHV